MSNDVFRTLCEVSDNAAFYCDLRTGETYRTSKLDLYDLGETALTDFGSLTGTGSFSFIHPEDIPVLLQYFKDSATEEKPVSTVIRLKMKDGSYRHSMVNGLFQRAEDGTPSAIYSTITDVERFYENDSARVAPKQHGGLLDTIPTGIGIFECGDTGVSLVYMNEGYYEMVNRPLDDRSFWGDRWSDTVVPDDMGALLAELDDCFREERPYSCNYRVICGDGSTKWLALHGNHTLAANGKRILYCTFTDISDERFYITALEEKNREAERRISEERMRLNSLSGNIILGFTYNVTKNSDARFVFSKEYEDFLDPDSDRALAERLYREAPVPEDQKREAFRVMMQIASQICDEADRTRFIELTKRESLLKAFSEGRDRTEMEYRCRVRDTVLWISMVMTLLQDPATGDIIFFAYDFDITEKRVYQNIMSRIMAFDYATVAFYSIYDGAFHLYRGDEGAEHLFETFPYDEALASMFAQMDEGETSELARQYDIGTIVARLAIESPYSFYSTSRDRAMAIPSHPLRKMRHTVFYLDEHRDIIVFLLDDVTETFELEKENRERLAKALRSAETANAAKSEFLSLMSHDIRTPLNGIIGMTLLAKDEDNPPKTDTYLDKIDGSGHFLLSLVNDILDMSQIDAGKLELHPEPYSEREFLKYLDDVIQPLCAMKNITFTYETIGKERDFRFLTDKLRYNQIYFNLLSNAVKFTPEGGHIRLYAKNLHREDGVIAADGIVEDDGMGMSEEFQEKIFHAFEQEHTDRNKTREGSGLGLAITKSLVEAMGGTIRVESAPGRGSRFIVRIPLEICSEEPDESDYAPAPGRYDLSDVHILLGEDNAINAEIACGLLEKAGASVDVAEDGQGVIDLFISSPVDTYQLILMDIRMPRMDGLEATEHIRALGRDDAKTIPILAMTANAYREDVEECLAAGMDDHIAKPIEPGVLYRLISEHLAHGR